MQNIFIATSDTKFGNELLKALYNKFPKVEFSIIKDVNDLPTEVDQKKPVLLITNLWLNDRTKKNCFSSDGNIEFLNNLSSIKNELQIIVLDSRNASYRYNHLLDQGVLALFNQNIDVKELDPFIKMCLTYGEVNSLKLKSKSLTSKLDKDLIGDYSLINGSELEKIYMRAQKIATSDDPVLILGETGTGKEHLSKFIHKCSNRKNFKFVTVDLSTLPSNLITSHLFGYKKGSFTGASQDTKGLVEIAEGGTLFLDEIGNIDFDSQASLLRLLENKEYYVVGSNILSKANVRIITATNKSVNQLRDDENFKNDLYHRLNKYRLKLPALRDRSIQEKLDLAKHFVHKFSKEHNVTKSLSKDASKIIIEYEWPGNVRNMEKIIYNSCLESRNDIISEEIINRVIKEDRD